MGFVRLAIKTGSPIVPSVCIGIDEAYHVLFEGYKLSERVFGKGVFLPLSLPLGLGPLPFPVKLTHYVGEPIRFRYKPGDEDDPKKVARLHQRVLKSMELLFDRGMEEKEEREAQEPSWNLVGEIRKGLSSFTRKPGR